MDSVSPRPVGRVSTKSAPRSHRRFTRRRLESLILALVLILVGLGVAAPLLWVLMTSVKDNQALFSNPWGLPPALHFENYARAWAEAALPVALRNSLLVTVGALIIIIPAAAAGAYAFTGMRFRLRFLYLPILFSLAVPLDGLMIPLYVLLTELGLINTHLGLILCYAALNTPLAMFILGEFFRRIPSELKEAAQIEGATPFQVLVHVMLPLTGPAMAAVITIVFLFIWNEFTLAVVALSDPALFTVPVAMKNFVGGYWTEYPPLFASLVVATIPMLLIFISLQRQFVEGLTLGALRE